MKGLEFLIGMVVVVGLSGCRLLECSDCGCDDCMDENTGNLEVFRDWSALRQGMERPEEVDIYLYHASLAPRHEVTYNDVERYAVAPGHYEVLAVNRQVSALFQGMDDYYTAEVCLPTHVRDSCVIVEEAPLLLFDRTAVSVEEGLGRCTVVPAPFVKTINFSILVHRGENAGEIKACRGRLGGVLTSARICVRQQEWFSACLDFDTREEGADLFCKSVTLLGMSPDASHNLKLWLTDEHGTVREAEVDAGKLDFSAASVLNCRIEVNLAGTGTEVGIVDWEPRCTGDIVLQ
ncbi:MAG: DUF5119 domain-containing protein [Odoribacter sp.]|nr:DUF5119 domain-containing protein [Odoribacter sp.]